MYLSKINIVLKLTTTQGEVTLNYDPEKDWLSLINNSGSFIDIGKDGGVRIRAREAIPEIYWYGPTTMDAVLEKIVKGEHCAEDVIKLVSSDKYYGGVYEVIADKGILNQSLRCKDPYEYGKFLLDYRKKEADDVDKKALEEALFDYFKQDDPPKTFSVSLGKAERFSVSVSHAAFINGNTIQLAMVNDRKYDKTSVYYLDPNEDKLVCLSLTDLWGKMITKGEKG